MGKLLVFPERRVKACVFCSSYHNQDFDCMAKMYVLALCSSRSADESKRVFDALGEVESSTISLTLVPMPDSD